MIRAARGNVRRSHIPAIVAARPRLRGLGNLGFTYYDLLAAAGQENCDPKDSGCVARNQERANAVEDTWITQYMTNPNTANMSAPAITVNLDRSQSAVDAFMNNQPLTSETVSVAGSAPISVAQIEASPTYRTPLPGKPAPLPSSDPLKYTPRVAIANVSTGNAATLNVGDSWRVTITGGKPNAVVAVTGGKGSARDTNTVGSTDAAGNFSATGTISTNDIGTWFESWKVDGTPAGEFSFTVPQPQTLTPSGTPTGSGNKNTGGNLPGGSSDTPAASTTTFNFNELFDKARTLPWYAWAGIAAGGFILTRGGRR
jgi:hypothetical protein